MFKYALARKSGIVIGLAIYVFFCWLMLRITLQYLPFSTDVAFLSIKQEEVALPYYISAFYLHVYTSIFVLLAGFTQFSRRLRSNYPVVHRRMGRLYIWVIIFLAGPSGLVIGYHANGGWSSQLAFCLLAVLWILFTVIAELKARKRDWAGHRDFMIRSFALSMSAISLRLWKFSLVAIFAPRPMDVYRWVAWLAWVINLLLAEWIIHKLKGKTLFRSLKNLKTMKYFLIVLPFLFLLSCQNAPTDTTATDVSEQQAAKAVAVGHETESTLTPSDLAKATAQSADNSAADVFLGSYTGQFRAKVYDENRNISWSNLITIFIDSLRADMQIFGHSVVAGNSRPFQGTYTLGEDGQLFSAIAKEPGDDRYDGQFEFRVNATNSVLTGEWTAYKKLGVSVRQYELEKRSFSYNPGHDLPVEGVWTDLYDSYDEESDLYEMVTETAAEYNASTQRLTKEMVENMYKGDLEVMRNAIYARHGYSFKNRRMRYVFDSNIDWYMPVSTDIRGQLTTLEKENIELIKRYEQHAQAYYDSFGR